MKQKNTKLLKGVFFLLVGFIIVHFSFSAIYQSNGKYTPFYLNKIVGKYMLSFFHQDWKLFAPDPPTCHIRLSYQLFNNNNWSDWQYFGEPILQRHLRNKFSSANLEYRLHQQLARNMVSDYKACETSDVVDCFKSSMALRQALSQVPELEIESSQEIRFKYECLEYTVKSKGFVISGNDEEFVFQNISLND